MIRSSIIYPKDGETNGVIFYLITTDDSHHLRKMIYQALTYLQMIIDDIYMRDDHC